MKVILTEAQLCLILLQENLNTMELNENKSFRKLKNKLKRKIRRFIINGIAGASLIAAIYALNISEEDKKELADFAKQEEVINSKKNTNRDLKIKLCREYMLSALINNSYNEGSTELSPEALVDTAEKYNFDLPLLLAAAHQESCFGAAPRARRTNSVYNVGSYDNGKNVVTYSHPNESVEGYIKLLLNDYLINGKTINDLLKPGKFVNKHGKRYASDKKYEQRLNYLRNRIIDKYPELA